jgi:GcrA cell cycle regulator
LNLFETMENRMSTDLTAKRRDLAMTKGRTRPNYEILAASDRHPDGDNRIPVAQRKTIATVEKSNCRWPIGDPKRSDFYLCGATTSDSGSYCEYHTQIARVPASNSKRAA